ncbi:hypothetical protein LA080_011645 [Diaporthe eres]|nr:hypothetical protein LA080_011645 [Diaporthe eres]
MKLSPILLMLSTSAAALTTKGRLEARRLPDHSKECMIEKANAVKNLPILKLNVKDFCDMPNWIRVGSWIDWHYFPCLDKKCPWPRDDSERESANWFRNTCGWSG